MQLLAKFTQESLCHGARITRAPFFFPSGASACRATVPRPRMQESQLGVRHLRPNAAVYRRVHLGEGLSCDTASSKGSPAQGRRDMDATPRKMIGLISDAYTRFVVPVYQRPYSWDIKQCVQLWDDIVSCGRNKTRAHFTGSIVSIQDGSVSSQGVATLLLIDGQQRTATMTLLLIALARYAATHPQERDRSSNPHCDPCLRLPHQPVPHRGRPLQAHPLQGRRPHATVPHRQPGGPQRAHSG